MSWQNSPPQAAFRTDGPACHLILAVIYGSVFTAAGESSRIFRRRLPRFSGPVRECASTFGYSVFKLQVRKAFVLACIGEEAYGLTTLKMQFLKIFLVPQESSPFVCVPLAGKCPTPARIPAPSFPHKTRPAPSAGPLLAKWRLHGTGPDSP